MPLLILLTLTAGNPIVHVTEQWQHMCGFTDDEARGRNPRVVQGTHTDPAVIQSLREAVRQQRACKALLLNYRGGQEAYPFWNMLSVSPIFDRGKLVLFMVCIRSFEQ